MSPTDRRTTLPASALRRGLVAPVAGALLVALAGCREDMHDQPRYEALEASSFFPDGQSARTPVENTIPRGHLELDDHLYRGRDGDAYASTFPFAIDREDIERGRDRYDIYCAPCHDRVGNGGGMVVRRGFRRPVSFHIERLRQKPVGYFFDVITAGFGAMPDYADELPARDRWRVVAYIRALQLSQYAPRDAVSAEELRRLDSGE